jgi:hypothetical protein
MLAGTNQGRQEHRDAEPDVHHRFPSPEERWSAITLEVEPPATPSSAAGRIPAAPPHPCCNILEFSPEC